MEGVARVGWSHMLAFPSPGDLGSCWKTFLYLLLRFLKNPMWSHGESWWNHVYVLTYIQADPLYLLCFKGLCILCIFFNLAVIKPFQCFALQRRGFQQPLAKHCSEIHWVTWRWIPLKNSNCCRSRLRMCLLLLSSVSSNYVTFSPFNFLPHLSSSLLFSSSFQFPSLFAFKKKSNCKSLSNKVFLYTSGKVAEAVMLHLGN